MNKAENEIVEANLKPEKSEQLNPAIILLIIVFVAMVLTFLVPSGNFQRMGKKVIPGTYQTMDKEISLFSAFNLEVRRPPSEEVLQSIKNARPVSVFETFMAVPRGIEKSAGLVVMVLFIGGMFGILNAAGAIEAGLNRLLSLTRGNIYVTVPLLMIVFSAGSTFIGLAKEFILIVPLMVAMARKLKLDDVTGLAIIAIPIKVGYMASISNPVALSVAQPIVGVPIFSGIEMRALTYLIFISLAIGFVIWKARKQIGNTKIDFDFGEKTLGVRHSLLLVALLAGVSIMIYSSLTWHWKYSELAGYYLSLSCFFALISGLGASAAADAFISGMKKVLIAGILIGLAKAVEIILSTGQIIDTIIHYAAIMIGQNSPTMAAISMFIASMGIDIFVPSTSGQAAITMPIFGPLGQITGVSPQTAVYTFLLGNGLTNFITPTSSGLLVLLATAGVSWTKWAKFILPLFIVNFLVAILLICVATWTGY